MGCSAEKIETKTGIIPQKNIQQLPSNTNIQIVSSGNNDSNSNKIQNPNLNNIENNKPSSNNSQNFQNNISNNNANNKINYIESKKDNNLKLSIFNPNIKLKAFKNYTNEECAQIYEILDKNESEFKTDVNIFYKGFVELQKEITTFTEYITLFTKKEKENKYSSTYEFNSPIIEGRKVLESFVKLNGIKFETYTKKITNKEYKITFLYDLNENDDSIITFEVLTMAKTTVDLDKTAIKLMFFPKFRGCQYSIIIECINNDFTYHNINNAPTGKNKFNIISPKKFEFIGKNCEGSNYIIFQSIDSKINLDKNDNAFYCYDEEEIKILEKSINSMKLYMDAGNFFSQKNFYNIIGVTCYVKSYISFLYLDNMGIYDSYDLFLPEKNELKFINLKCNNEDNSERQTNHCEISKQGLILSFNVPAKKNFCTLEIDYSFKIKDKEGRIAYIYLDYRQMNLGGYYQLFATFDLQIYKKFYLKRKKGSEYYDNNKIKLQVFYEPLNDNKYPNFLYLYYQ